MLRENLTKWHEVRFSDSTLQVEHNGISVVARCDNFSKLFKTSVHQDSTLTITLSLPLHHPSILIIICNDCHLIIRGCRATQERSDGKIISWYETQNASTRRCHLYCFYFLFVQIVSRAGYVSHIARWWICTTMYPFLWCKFCGQLGHFYYLHTVIILHIVIFRNIDPTQQQLGGYR